MQYNHELSVGGWAGCGAAAVWSQALSGGALEEAGEEELEAALSSGDAARCCAIARKHPAERDSGLDGRQLENGSNLVKPWFTVRGRAPVCSRIGRQSLCCTGPGRENTLAAAREASAACCALFAGGDYAVYPETLLFDSERLSLPLLEAPLDLFGTQGSAGLEGLLQAFSFGVYGFLHGTKW